MIDRIKNRVHTLYWEDDINCARTMLICLSELFQIPLEQQVMKTAVGLHGAGGYRAQCGLVEGGLMFIGIYFDHMGKTQEEVVAACYGYAEKFHEQFGSLRCLELRPEGFREEDPPHLCEKLTCEAVYFAYEYIAGFSVS